MGKRSREEVNALATSEDVTGLREPSGQKKRRLKEANGVDGDYSTVKKDKKSKTSIGKDEGEDISKTPIEISQNEKAVRKAEKKRLKAEKKAAKAINGTATTTGSRGITISAEEPSAEEEKAARKAEKKRLKSLKKQQKSETNGADSNGHVETTEHDGTANGHAQPTGAYQEDPRLSQLPQKDTDDYLSKESITITDPKSKKPLRPITAFSYLPAITGPSPFAKFKSPTPIQAATWPFILDGRDVVGIAETGSGKTLAFGVPLIQHITATKSTGHSKHPARAVIVSPTRELAVQIHEQIEMLAKTAGFKAVCIYGGVPKEPQKEGLKTASVIIATPGRLNDLLQEGSANVSKVDYLVLDEADRMLDKGFEEEIKTIISGTLPKEQRQTLMFTATWPQSVRLLASTFMENPVKITIGDHASGELRANTRIEQRVEVLDTHPRTKETRLLQLLKELQPAQRKKSGDAQANRVLIFALYKKEAARIEGFLHQRGLNAVAIHGDLSQEKRSASLNGFRDGTTPLLVATDVAARGLDIPAVKAVINLTFPLTVEDYVHRIGRTGRAGSNGLAITFFTEHDKDRAGGLVNVLKAANQPVPEELLKFGGTVKKKQHDAYGAFYKEPVSDQKATKVKFDD